MLSNGTPILRPKSFRNSVSIRNMAAGLGNGIGESLRRFRGEMYRARSLWLVLRFYVSGSVRLEFDEEDEDLLTCDSQLDVPSDNSIFRRLLEEKVPPCPLHPPVSYRWMMK